MSDLLTIINGISQVVSNIGYDGAADEKGELYKIGLKREEGHPILDSRVIDGFKIKIHRDMICVVYQRDCLVKDVHVKGFLTEVESCINDVVKALKKEYKKVTGNALTLKAHKDIEINCEYLSRVRTKCTAIKYYDLGGYTKDTESMKNGEELLDDSIRKFLQLGKNG